MTKTVQELFSSYMNDELDSNSLIVELQTRKESCLPNLDFNGFYDGWTPIHYAAYKRDLNLFTFLVNEGVDLKAKTEGENDNIMHLALKNENCSQDFIIRLWHAANTIIKDSSANLYLDKNSSNHTPLHYMAEKSHPEIFGTDSSRLLPEELLGFAITDDVSAFGSNDLKKKYTAEQLKEALVTAINSNNDSFVYDLYHYNSEFSYPVIYQHLYKKENWEDAFPKMKKIRNNELTFLEKARNNDSNLPFDLFRININCLDKDCKSALEYAAKNENLELCAKLIELGIDVNRDSCNSFCDLPEEKKQSVSVFLSHNLEYSDKKLLDKLKSVTLWQEFDSLQGDKIKIQRNILSELEIPQDGSGWKISEKEVEGEILLKAIYDEAFSFDQTSIRGAQEYFKLLANLAITDEKLRINIDNLKDKVIRIYSKDETSTGILSQEDQVYIASRGSTFNELIGRIAHEMCHFACDKIWNNNCIPYKSGTEEEKIMSEIYESLWEKYKNNKLTNQTLFLAFDRYQDGGKEKVIKELIVRVPQIILENGYKKDEKNGLAILKEQAPELLRYYEEVFIPKAIEYLQAQKSGKLEEKISRITGHSGEPKQALEEEEEYIQSLHENLGKALSEKDFKKAKAFNDKISEFLNKKLEQEQEQEEKKELETYHASQEKPKTRPESPKGSRIKTSKKSLC